MSTPAERARAAIAGPVPVPDQILNHVRKLAQQYRDEAKRHRASADTMRERMEEDQRSAALADEKAREWQAIADVYAQRVRIAVHGEPMHPEA